MVKNNPQDKDFGDYSEDDLKSFTPEPYIDYATGETVDERVIRHPPSEPFNLEKATLYAQWILRGSEEHLERFGQRIDAREVINLFKADKDFARVLTTVFAQAGYVLEPEKQGAELSEAPPDLAPAPDVASPKAPPWRGRERGINAVQFIRKNYGEMRDEGWHHNGFARADLKNNSGLYNAYTAWIMDHPEDKLEFALGGGKPPGRQPTADIAGLVERRRTYAREYRQGKKIERQHDAPLPGSS